MKEPSCPPPPWIGQLAADPTITSDALRLIVYVASLGPGEHEIEADTLRMLLRCRSDKPVYQARRVAERFGLRWSQGGRGHANRYRYLAPQDGVSDTSPHRTEYPNEYPSPQGEVNRYSAPQDGVNVPVVVEGVGVGGGEEGEARAPAQEPHVPTHPLSAKAEEVLTDQGDELNGCRGALRDYLQARVPTDRQYGYVRTVLAFLDGRDATVFRLPDGSRAPPEEIRGLLVTALNELLATDETMMKRSPGDPSHLRTKLSVLCKMRGDNGNGHRKTAPENSPGGDVLNRRPRADRRRGKPQRS